MLSRLISTSLGSLALAACLPTIVLAQSSVNWRTNLDQAKLEAAQTQRMLLIHFTTKKCGPCKLLDQQVFNQPQVGPAIEQSYVPVRLDADDNQAQAIMFRVREVPAEFIITPEGKILANPPIPNQPDAYLAQLQNIARHYQQQAAAQAALQSNVNSAYAGLPAAGGQQVAPSPLVINNPAMQQAQQPPQAQINPYASASASPNVYGQAQNVYAVPAQQPQTQSPVPSSQQPSAPAMDPALAAQTPVMPSNAMPRSFRPPVDAAAPAIPAATAAVPNATAQSVATTASNAVSGLGQSAQRPKPELPAGSPPLAFDGFCPVTLKTLNRWAEGNGQFGAIHRGRTYLFAGAEQRNQFLANPDSFSPVFAGLDPVLLIENQQTVEGSRALGYRYGESFYLFSSEETKQKFAASPHTYAAGVRQAMNRIDAAGTVRR